MENTGCCCRSNAIAPDSLEAKDVRRKAALFLLRLSWVQIVASVLSVITGLVSVGVALTNPTYPKINGHAVLTGILITIHFTLSVTCISMSVLQILFTGWAVGECFSTNQDTAYKCQPYETANVGLGFIVIFLGVVQLITSIVGSTFLCSYKRVFAFMDYQDRIQQEMALLSDKSTQGSCETTHF
ncbi:uncharacterized protein [Haliotis cracherodii]|uniref:uncharacterized protein isoform X2 n=1 Tax=Haliotis cracherodii TaxID=6455 RepID=UPI0039EAB332